MEFNKSRVFTALNADKLKAGDIVYVSDTIARLKAKVEEGNAKAAKKIECIGSDEDVYRFCIKYPTGRVVGYNCAYLVKRTEEKKWRPYKDCDEMVLDFCRRFVTRELDRVEVPLMWVMSKSKSRWTFVSDLDFSSKTVFIGHDRRCSLTFLFENYTWLDSSPCGVQEGEDKEQEKG